MQCTQVRAPPNAAVMPGAGGGMVSRFVEVFRDLGSFSEVLQTQLELLLCERLTQTWVKVQSLRPQCPD